MRKRDKKEGEPDTVFVSGSIIFFASAIAAENILRIIHKTFVGIHTLGPGCDVLLSVRGKAVEIAPCLRAAVQQGKKIGIFHF